MEVKYNPLPALKAKVAKRHEGGETIYLPYSTQFELECAGHEGDKIVALINAIGDGIEAIYQNCQHLEQGNVVTSMFFSDMKQIEVLHSILNETAAKMIDHLQNANESSGDWKHNL